MGPTYLGRAPFVVRPFDELGVNEREWRWVRFKLGLTL